MKFDLVDRRCIVTGASSGIGKEIARNLAYFGATVVLACRSRERGSAALQEIAEDSGNDRLSLLPLELADPESIRGFAHQVTTGDAPVHVLVNNAGTYTQTRETTPAGRELTWATNVLGPFMLTNLLAPALVATGPSRVVNVASKLAGGLDLDDLDFETRSYSGIKAYKQSKQANRMLSWGCQQRIGDIVSVNACHPGGVNTRIYDNLSGLAAALAKLGRHFMKTPAEGARTPTRLAADPDLGNLRAEFWSDEAPAKRKFTDRAAIDALWTRCVALTQTDL
ncbi:MAG: SDR family NAD(P)-dependent oxidoreductase [Nannocystaceae bacterium]|nr:SDR family NAD(P)-dependent oxidoreductase [Nannocystaceae bacterium]